MTRQVSYPICGDCALFDKESWGFRDSNLCKCVEDGRRHWVGTPADRCGNGGFIGTSRCLKRIRNERRQFSPQRK
jgi:hypothetical protein